MDYISALPFKNYMEVFGILEDNSSLGFCFSSHFPFVYDTDPC